jgi:hypothetical protein
MYSTFHVGSGIRDEKMFGSGIRGENYLIRIRDPG